VLLEAMAQGAPVVSTAELGTKSILTPGCGALVVHETVEEFASAVTRVLRDSNLKQRLSQQSRAHAEKWSSLSMATRLAALYAATCESYRQDGRANKADVAQRPAPGLRS
jgi:glycosyltransferase involved in cell wall biosynthesis